MSTAFDNLSQSFFFLILTSTPLRDIENLLLYFLLLPPHTGPSDGLTPQLLPHSQWFPSLIPSVPTHLPPHHQKLTSLLISRGLLHHVLFTFASCTASESGLSSSSPLLEFVPTCSLFLYANRRHIFDLLPYVLNSWQLVFITAVKLSVIHLFFSCPLLYFLLCLQPCHIGFLSLTTSVQLCSQVSLTLCS